MGYRKVPTIYTLTEFKDDPGLVVRMKAIKIGKIRKLIKVVDADGVDEIEALDEVFGLMLDGLVSWNLEDEEGRELPTTMEGIEELEMPLLMQILTKWLENMTGVDADLGKDSPSGASFPGRPLTMEAL